MENLHMSSVGVLTTDGKLDPSMIRALLDAGFFTKIFGLLN